MSTLMIVTESQEAYQEMLENMDAETLKTYQGVVRVGSMKEALEYLEFGPAMILKADGKGNGTSAQMVGCCISEEGLLQGDLFPAENSHFMTSARRAVEDVCGLIEKEFEQNKNAREYSHDVCVSETYLCRVFKKVKGVTIGEYVLKTRMLEAGRLLGVETNTSIKEIARKVGYGNFSYFCRRFRDYHGVSPREYRKKAAEGTA